MLVFWFSYLTLSSTNVVHLDIRVIFLYVCYDLCVLLVKLTSVLVMPIKILNLESVMRRIRSFIKPSIMKLTYDRTIQPVIDYGCSVWYNTTCKNVEKLQKVQNYAARIISGNFDYINVRSISLIRSLKWMTISERCEYFTAMLMFKAINGLVLTISIYLILLLWLVKPMIGLLDCQSL